jgi:predicted Zn-dependent protease
LPKVALSPFERSDVSRVDTEIVPATPYIIQTIAGQVVVLPLVCIEALRLQSVRDHYDLTAIVSFDQKPTQFAPFITEQVRNRKPVLYCNDGAFGGSRVGAIQDARVPSWIHDALPDGLPSEDAILLIDLDLDVTAVETGTALPQSSVRLVALASVVGEHSDAADVGRELATTETMMEGVFRAERLRLVGEARGATHLQRVRINHLSDLERRGVPCSEWWRVLGSDCIVGGQNDLRHLEGQLAATCRDELMRQLPPEAMGTACVLQFYAECTRRSATAQASDRLQPTSRATAVVDRDAEVRAIAGFLDSRELSVLEVTGLPQIGKSCTLDKAIAQSGVSPVFRLSLTSTSSVDYLLFALLKRGPGRPVPPYESPVDVATSPSVESAIRSARVIIFERAHLLVDAGMWRDESFGPVFAAIIEVAQTVGTKIVFEAQRDLPLELQDAAARKKLRVRGLNKHLVEFGQALLDAQLRRVELSPSVLSHDQKQAIVERLGGHPVAIALAADSCYDDGGEGVLSAVKERKGFYLSFLHRLLRDLALTDEDQTILRLLTLARVPVERSVVMTAVPFPAAPVLRNLVGLGAVDVSPEGRLEIAGILREYFEARDLPPELTISFHRQAAFAFQAAASREGNDIQAAVEAEYHGGVIGMPVAVVSRVVDGALATAQEQCRLQKYDSAGRILDVLLQRHRSADVLRLAAIVAARLNQSRKAVALAREVLVRNPKDTRLLADLAKIALTQYQDDTTASELVQLARRIGVEDVSVMVIEGRMHLRRQHFGDAEEILRRACQLTQRNPWPFYYLGTTYMRMGRLGEAITVLEDGERFFYDVEARSRHALNAIRTQLGLAYLLDGDVEAAGRILDPLLQDDPTGPEVARAYAALTIQRDGIQEAQKAFARLNEASIRNRFDQCQFHLFYGLFQIGIGNAHEAAREFAKAHQADRSNVYVMMKWARTLYEIGEARFQDGEDVHKAYLRDCAHVVREILRFDPDNAEGVDLMAKLHQRFGISVEDSEEIT